MQTRKKKKEKKTSHPQTSRKKQKATPLATSINLRPIPIDIPKKYKIEAP
jgi:hypothetical protein